MGTSPAITETAASFAKDKRAQGVGASVLRKEDDRFLRGRGQYVGDIRLPDMQDVAFVRSPLAHARIVAIHIPPPFAIASSSPTT